MLTDTHTHLYLPEFDQDREVAMERAFGQGIERIFLPNIDADSIAPMLALCGQYPENCFPMLGLHPCSVKAGFRQELEKIKVSLEQHSSPNQLVSGGRHTCVAIGEIGLDFYWDKSFVREQEEAFRIQVGWAVARDLPIVIHSRDSFDEICQLLIEEKQQLPAESGLGIRGIFHCFTGTYEQACRAIDLGFYLGIGGGWLPLKNRIYLRCFRRSAWITLCWKPIRLTWRRFLSVANVMKVAIW